MASQLGSLQTVAGHHLRFGAGHAEVHPVLTATAMREADRLTIEEYGIPGFTLMESAGRAAAEAITRRYGPAEHLRVAVLCGKGNNGGDGLVVSRVLHAQGAKVHVILTEPEEALSPDAGHNYRLLRALQEHAGKGQLTIEPYPSIDQLGRLPRPDCYIDALLGTGLASPLRPPMADIVYWLNEQPEPVIALDLPTGLQSDNGEIMGAIIRADLTVTMAALKAGLLLGEGPTFAGDIEVIEIGIPAFLLEQTARKQGGALLATDAAVRAWLPQRSSSSHKYNVGLALVVGGSAGLTGAPAMASMATARSGAGAVVCACSQDIQPLLATKLTEVMTLGLPVSASGGINTEKALQTLQPRLDKARALLVGPGLGTNPDTQHFIRTLLAQVDIPVVIDADGLNALTGHEDFIREHSRGRWILTPHAGEFQRLASETVDLTDRIQVVREYARRFNCTLILKGLPSVVGCPDGTVYVNGTGNPALATAGTGDVLAGLCAGLLAQGLPPERAAVCALHLGGAAADRYRDLYDARTMLAADLLAQLPLVLKERFAWRYRL